YALHHAAVSRLRVDVEVEERVAVPVVAGGQPPARDGHPHGRGHALTQGACGGLDSARPTVLGVARALGVELPEGLQILEGDSGLPEDLVLGIDCPDARQ